jgi:outer membrane protein assembly factor BamB
MEYDSSATLPHEDVKNRMPNDLSKGGNMIKQLWFVFFSLVLVTLLVSACQPIATIPKTATETLSPTVIPMVLPTVSPTANPVPTTVPTPEVVWNYETGAAIWGTPTINDDTVYFGSDDGKLYAVDAQTGSPRWEFPTQGFVRSQPAVMGEMVYFTSDDGFLYAVDAQRGTLAWRTDIGNALTPEVRKNIGTNAYDYRQSSPIVVDGEAYVGSLDGNVYALSANTGQVIWTYNTNGKVRATPVLANGTLYVGSWDGYSYALDVNTGQLLWKEPLGGAVQSTALVVDGVVYTASREASVFALDATTGKTKWEYSYGNGMWVESSPTLVDGILYVGSSGSQIIVGFDSQTGNVVTTFYSVAFHWGTPVLVNQVLYMGGTSKRMDENDGGLYRLMLVDGKFASEFATRKNRAQWLFFPVLGWEGAERNLSGVASSPVVQNGILYFGGLDGRLYAMNTVP